MTMQAVYNNVLRPVVCDADGKLITTGSGGSTDALTNTQLRATPVPVVASARVCLGTARATITTSSQTLATCIGTSIPTGSVTCEIQADGGSVRMRRDAGTPTTTLGYRIDDGVEKLVDTTLADIRLISGSASTVFANVIFFDKV